MTPSNSPEQLATHMIGKHWEDSWTLRMENTPMEFRIAMKGANNQVQAKNMGTIAKEVEAVETTRKASDLANNKKSCAGTQTKEGKKKPTNPTSTLKETREAQRETTDRTMNSKTNTKKKQSEAGTGTRPKIEPPPQPPAQHAGPSQYRKTSTVKEGKTPLGQRNAL